MPDPSTGKAVPAAVTAAAPAVCAPLAVWFVWLVAGRPAWPARPVARPERFVGATPAAETLGAVDVVPRDAVVWVSGVPLVAIAWVPVVGALTGGVWTGGAVTVGVLIVGVVMLGMLTVGVVIAGVLTVPTPTEGTVIVGTVIAGTETVGTEIVGTETVGTESAGTEAWAAEAAEPAKAPHTPSTISLRRLMRLVPSRGRRAARRRSPNRRTRPSELQTN